VNSIIRGIFPIPPRFLHISFKSMEPSRFWKPRHALVKKRLLSGLQVEIDRCLTTDPRPHELRTYDMLRTLAAVAARATARAAECYGRRRILETITGGVTLSDVLLRATTKELPRLLQRTASLPVLAAREASADLPWPASALSWPCPCSAASRPASPRTDTASALVPGCRDEADTTSACANLIGGLEQGIRLPCRQWRN
jgi:hypothetical protein